MAVRYNNNPSKLNMPEAVSFKGLLGCFVNFDLENVVFTSPSLSQGMSGFLILYNLDKTYWFHDFTPLDRQDTHLSIIMFWKRHTEFNIIHHLQKTLIILMPRGDLVNTWLPHVKPLMVKNMVISRRFLKYMTVRFFKFETTIANGQCKQEYFTMALCWKNGIHVCVMYGSKTRRGNSVPLILRIKIATSIDLEMIYQKVPEAETVDAA
ncbi:hypothetical protein BD769DRAFT_1395867 [Suillus cothurnatus]|nr:hypothetical protein BD769DRAFT_1395867 [Suillus cothurnatus]